MPAPPPMLLSSTPAAQRPRRLRALAVVLALAALAAAGPGSAGSPATAQASSSTAPVWPGLLLSRHTVTLAGGRPAVSHVLSWSAGDESLSLRPVLAQDQLRGLETVPSMGRRHLPAGAVAGVNGGFWMSNPVGDPNGYFAAGGVLVSEPESQGMGPRGTFALTVDRRPLIDRIWSSVRLVVDGLDEVGVAGINRYHRTSFPHPDPAETLVYVYQRVFGPEVAVREDLGTVTAFTITGMDPPASGAAAGTVGEVLTAAPTLPVPDDGVLVVAYGAAAEGLAGVRPLMPAALTVELQPQDEQDAPSWTTVTGGLAAGPLLVRGGAVVDPEDWFDEGFSPETHSNVRHPRSAVALTADGRILLVTVDGRQPGYSHGMTLRELAEHLIGLGAVEGLSLDGGGSSQLAVDGLLRNRACCDAHLRPVADGLFVFHDYVFEASERLAGDGRAATAAAIALAAYPDGAQEVVVASAGGFPDALAGGPLASALGAPLLLTAADELVEVTRAAIERLNPRRITVLGGEGVVGPDVEAALAGMAQVRRLAGRERTETAAAIARALPEPTAPGADEGEAGQQPTTARRVFVATAGGFADALSAAAPAGMLGDPILLTYPGELPAATRQAVRDLARAHEPVEVIILGGEQAVGGAVTEQLGELGVQTTRLSGRTRYGTAVAVSRWAVAAVQGLDLSGLVVARGADFPDALAGGPLAAQRRQLLLIVPGADVSADPDVQGYLEERAGDLDSVTLLGGHAALSSYQQWQLDQLAQR